MIIVILCSPEIYSFSKKWDRWKVDEYYHQFDHNIGLGNLKDIQVLLLFLNIYIHLFTILNHAYLSMLIYIKHKDEYLSIFDPFKLRPLDSSEYRSFLEAELNNGRLAMIGFSFLLYILFSPIKIIMYNYYINLIELSIYRYVDSGVYDWLTFTVPSCMIFLTSSG